MTMASSVHLGEDRASRWILLVSLGLNLFFIGAGGALAARHYFADRDGRDRSGRSQRGGAHRAAGRDAAREPTATSCAPSTAPSGGRGRLARGLSQGTGRGARQSCARSRSSLTPCAQR